MAEHALPLDRFSAQAHMESLQDLIDRYEHEGEPVHYKKAASSLSETTVSSCLRFFSDINLIEAEKQGIYVPTDPVIDYFTKVGKAKEEATIAIAEILSEDTVYYEVDFHLDEDGIDKSELATKTAGGLEINKDEIPKIERTIEIFAELEAVDIDEEGIVTPPTSSGGPTDEKESNDEQTDSGGRETDLDVSETPSRGNRVDPEELELPPSKGDPESLHTLCTHLRKGGKWSVSEIADEAEFATRTARGYVRYGEELGFIREDEEGISPTKRGYDLGFHSELNEETQEYFLEGILESDFYYFLLSKCLEDVLEEAAGELAITTTSAEKQLRTHFGFTEEKEGTLRDVINTFFKTVEGSGYGQFIIGRGGRDTRLEITSKDANELNLSLHAEVAVEDSKKEENSEEAEDLEGEGEQEESEKRTIKNKEKEHKDPGLRISSFRIQNFRNIQDSGVISLEDITTFIGKNECGKTSTLEAIASFENSYPYHPKDICNDINYHYQVGVNGGDLPVLTLTFEITEEVIDRFYPDSDFDQNLPITYEVTQFADGHIEGNSDIEIPRPSPDIIYYNEYDRISDSLYFDESSDNQNRTFKNLLQIGELDESDITSLSGLEHHQAIEDAENRIESRLNRAWSQKDIRINLRYNDPDNAIELYIQDELEEQERTLTQPSQRSEGFQWFFSFYVNLLAETSAEDDGYKILLLDDPAVHLHPSGKQDWLDSLEEIAEQEQVLYTSHSPYLIKKRYPSRIRTVQDSPIGTQISADIFDADTGTLEPLRNALGINLSSSPFVSEGQILVEGPSEYYVLTAVSTYFEEVLERDFIDWRRVSVMPVRGARDTIGKASWLASEDIEYAVLLDSDEEGQDVEEQIRDHHHDVDDERVILLERRPHETDVVLEDLFAPEFYVEAFNEFYIEFTKGFDNEFEPLSVDSEGHSSWEIGVSEYEGKRIDEVLVSELERQDVADELRNDEGEIELFKRQIAEVISDKINNGEVEEDDLEFFNPVFAKIDDRIDL